MNTPLLITVVTLGMGGAIFMIPLLGEKDVA
jgi:hypothetical protein